MIGIDVGGTTTDAVLIDEGKVIKTSKVPTDHDHLLECLMAALDEIVLGIPPEKIERVVLSTTLITNLIAEGKTDPVALIIEPGPGMNPDGYSLGGEVQIVRGAIDYRGREIEALDEDQFEKAAAKMPIGLQEGGGGEQVRPEEPRPRGEDEGDLSGRSPGSMSRWATRPRGG